VALQEGETTVHGIQQLSTIKYMWVYTMG